MIVGEIMRMAAEIFFKTHCYSLKGSVFRQVGGAASAPSAPSPGW